MFTIHAQDNPTTTDTGGDIIIRAGDGCALDGKLTLQEPGKDITAKVGEIWMHNYKSLGLIVAIHSADGHNAYNLKVLRGNAQNIRGNHKDFAKDTFHDYWTLLDTNICLDGNKPIPFCAKEHLCFKYWRRIVN